MSAPKTNQDTSVDGASPVEIQDTIHKYPAFEFSHTTASVIAASQRVAVSCDIHGLTWPAVLLGFIEVGRGPIDRYARTPQFLWYEIPTEKRELHASMVTSLTRKHVMNSSDPDAYALLHLAQSYAERIRGSNKDTRP